MSNAHRSVVAALALAVAACGGSKKKGTETPEVEPAVVTFTNQAQYEAVVYTEPRGGLRVRVGTVPPGRTEKLLLRSSALGAGGSVTIIARVSMLNRAPTTGVVTLLPGDRVDVTLTSQANMLSIVPSP